MLMDSDWKMMTRLPSLTAALLAGCTFNAAIPLGDSMPQQQKQSMSNKQQQEQSQEASTSANQQSSHASESKQGTNAMPVVIICNQLSSSRSSCVTPQQPLSTSIKELQK